MNSDGPLYQKRENETEGPTASEDRLNNSDVCNANDDPKDNIYTEIKIIILVNFQCRIIVTGSYL